MKAIKIPPNILFIAGIILLAFYPFLLVLPEYYVCKNAYEGEDATTIWGYKVDCIGDSEFTLVFFQLISYRCIYHYCYIASDLQKQKRMFDPIQR